jgi:predicted phosphodiesterase
MRAAVLSDIHANLVALDAVLAAIGDVDEVWQLGDVVGYGPEPDGVVDRLRGIGAVGVRGNHDAAAIGDLDLDWFNADARRAIEWTRASAAPRTLDWLGSRPEIELRSGAALVHGSLRDPTWEYITHAPVARASLDRLADHGVDLGLFGHTHLPAAFRMTDGRVETIEPAPGATLVIDDRPTLLNPGSVGQPRDGDPAASAMVLDLERRQAAWVRVPYDVPAVQATMRDLGLPERLAARLSYGL